MCYKAEKVQKHALNSQIHALQILTNDDEVEKAKSSKAGTFSYQLNNIQSTMHSYIILFLNTHTCILLQACFPHMYTILHNLEINLF